MFTQDEVQIIEGINQIPIFNIENVRGKCIITPNGKPQSLVLADDIAREGGLTSWVLSGHPTSGMLSENDGHAIFGMSSEHNGHTIFGMSKLQRPQVEVIRWNRFNQYVNDSIASIQKYNPSILQYLPLPIKSGSYIPLEVALIVLMRLNSKKAQEFRVILASKIAPELTNHAIQVYQQQLLEYQQQVQQAQQDVQYYQDMIDTDQLYSTTEIAREFEMSPQQLRKILQELDVIRLCNKTWQVSARFIHCDYVRNKYNTNTSDHPYWTQYGRRFVIDYLDKHGYKLHQNNNDMIIPLVIID